MSTSLARTDYYFAYELYVCEGYCPRRIKMRQIDFTDEVVRQWGRIQPEARLTHLGVIQRLIWSGRFVERLLTRAAQKSGFNRRGDYEVLAVLRRSDPERLTSLELADQLKVSPSGMTGKLDRLESGGLIERQPDPTDRRVVRIFITDQGRSVADRVFADSLELHAEVFGALSQSEHQQLDALLRRLLAHLDELAGQ